MPASVEKVVAVEGMTDSSLRSVLGTNAMSWFDLSPSEVPSQSVWSNGRQRDRTWPDGLSVE